MGPKIIIHNRLDGSIDFLMEVDGRVVGLGVCSIRSVEPNKIRKVSQRKVLSCCHRHESSWRIRIVVDGKYAGLIIEPIHLLDYKCIEFVYETVDGSIVLKAKGLRTRGKASASRFISQLRWSYGLGSRRHREYRMVEEKDVLEDVAEVRMEYEGTGLIFHQSDEYERTPQLCRHCQSLLNDSSAYLQSPHFCCSSSEDSCQQPLDGEKVLLPAYSPVSDGIHGVPTLYVSGNEVSSSTDEVDAPTNINMCSSHSSTNALLDICDTDSGEGTTNIELPEDGKNYSATARLWGSGRSASTRWFAFSKQKAMALVGTANSLIATVSDYSLYDS